MRDFANDGPAGRGFDPFEFRLVRFNLPMVA